MAMLLPWGFMFRKVLQKLFLWRLGIAKPALIVLGLDTMVMDNDEADKRHGVKPTYKKVKGFQPLQLTWGRFIIDAIFRSGDKHSNHSNDAEKMLRHIVSLIRKHYRAEVPIVIRMDSGFFDQKIFDLCEKLDIGYICGGKLYKDIKAMVEASADRSWRRFENSRKEDIWEYMEFGSKRGNWKKFRRAFYCRLINNGQQLILPGCRPDTVIITNLGQGQPIDELLKQAGADFYLESQAVIACYHERGSDELANRALKDFGHEQLPFKRFAPNAAWYYTMLVGHFLLESFKEDVSTPVIDAGAYANTVRRKLIDIAGKIVSHGGKIILKFTSVCFDNLRLPELFERCNVAPAIR